MSDPAYHSAPHCAEGCLGAYALDVGAAKTIRVCGEVTGAHPRRQRLGPQMDLEDQAAALLVGQGDIDDLIKAPRRLATAKSVRINKRTREMIEDRSPHILHGAYFIANR